MAGASVERSGKTGPFGTIKESFSSFHRVRPNRLLQKTDMANNLIPGFLPSGSGTRKTGNIHSSHGETFESLARFYNITGQNRHMAINATRPRFSGFIFCQTFSVYLPVFLFVLFPVPELSCFLTRWFVNVSAAS